MDTPHLILAVDDDSSFLLSIKKLLKISGFNVRTTDNPVLVMDEIRSYDFSAVLLDIQMPGVTGIELIKQILAERPSIPIIVISGNSGIEIAVELFGAERPVRVGEQNAGRSNRSIHLHPGSQGQVAVVAVLHEARGEVPREGDLLGETSARQ